jgi:hypothetical protein
MTQSPEFRAYADRLTECWTDFLTDMERDWIVAEGTWADCCIANLHRAMTDAVLIARANELKREEEKARAAKFAAR